MVPLAQVGVEYGALLSRDGLARFANDLEDAIASPSVTTIAWVAAAAAIVLLATRRRARLAFALLLVSAATIALKALDLW